VCMWAGLSRRAWRMARLGLAPRASLSMLRVLDTSMLLMPPSVSVTADLDSLVLDPEIEAFRRELAAGWARFPNLDDVSLAEGRRIAEAVRAPFARGGPPMASTTQHTVMADGLDVRVRLHVPQAVADAGGAAAAMIYVHGGGWRLFSIDSHDRLMREYAERARVVVVGVDYALSPEAPYPRALRQVVDVFRWLQANATELVSGIAPGPGSPLAIDAGRIAIGGDSAGANLALAAAMMLRQASHTPPPCALVLNYGTFFHDVDSPSHRLYGGPAYSLTSDEMLGFWRDYLGDSATRPAVVDPLAEPLRASLDDLAGLPPCYLAIAQCDVLRDDSIAMAARLAAAGVAVHSVVYEGATHSFLEAMETAAVSRRALDETAAWLRVQLANARPC
jgi:acetyl esterase